MIGLLSLFTSADSSWAFKNLATEPELPAENDAWKDTKLHSWKDFNNLIEQDRRGVKTRSNRFAVSRISILRPPPWRELNYRIAFAKVRPNRAGIALTAKLRVLLGMPSYQRNIYQYESIRSSQFSKSYQKTHR